jgi:hypothetical protein
VLIFSAVLVKVSDAMLCAANRETSVAGWARYYRRL